MSPLLIQFVMLLWLGDLTVTLLAVVAHARRTRVVVARAFAHNAGVRRFDFDAPLTMATRSRGNEVPTGPQPVVPPPRSDREIVAAPPTVRGVGGDPTVRDWLKYHSHRDLDWMTVVHEFYLRAAADPRIGPYFVGHFTAAMIMVTCDGVTVGGLRSMARVHRGVTDTAGDPITGDVYDRTVNLLVEVLAGHGVPDDAINDLARVVAPLREAIVTTR